MFKRSLVVFGVGALVAIGCGDEESGGDDFVAQADQICRDFTEERIASQPETPPETAEEQLAIVEEAQAQREAALADLQAVEPPADSATAYDEFLTAREELIAIVEEEIQLLEKGAAPDDPDYQQVIADFDEAGARSEELAGEAGLTVCAQQLTPETEEETKAVVERFETEALEDCAEVTTDRALEELFGGLEKCQKIQENPPPEGFTEAVEFGTVTGTEDLTAFVRATLEGGPNDGATLEYGLLYEDGAWKVDTVTEAPPE